MPKENITYCQIVQLIVKSDSEVWHEDEEKTARRLTDQNSACQHISVRLSIERYAAVVVNAKRNLRCEQRMKEQDLKERKEGLLDNAATRKFQNR